MTNHVNSRKVESKVNGNGMELKWNFLFENFLSIQVSIETLKDIFTIIWQ